MKYYLNNQQVEVLETDWEMGEGAWVIDAVFVDSLAPLSERELEELSNRYQESLYQDAYEHMVCSAEDYFENR